MKKENTNIVSILLEHTVERISKNIKEFEALDDEFKSIPIIYKTILFLPFGYFKQKAILDKMKKLTEKTGIELDLLDELVEIEIKKQTETPEKSG